jgi:transposase-like protein
VKINGETHYLWRAVDHEGEVLESFVTKRRDRRAALAFLKKAMKRYSLPKVIRRHLKIMGWRQKPCVEGPNSIGQPRRKQKTKFLFSTFMVLRRPGNIN